MLKKTLLISFLGDINYDARCLNMIDSVLQSNRYCVTVIHVGADSVAGYSSQINIINFTLSKALYKYLEFYLKIKKIVKKQQFDILIAGDLYSLPGLCAGKGKIVFDSREIYTSLAAHINKPAYRWFWYLVEAYCLKFVSVVLTTSSLDKIFIQKKHQKHKHLFYYNI